jgi:hypothetical protein
VRLLLLTEQQIMSSDLMQRLRDQAMRKSDLDRDKDLLSEAADRIEALEAALRDIADGTARRKYGENREDIQDYARHALEGK